VSTTLEPALNEALAFLIEISRDGTRPTAAQTRLRDLRDRHPDLGLELIWQEEGYDCSVHYDLLLRRPQQGTVGLSYHPDRALPWPLRNMHRMSDRNLVRVNAVTIDVDQAVACLDFIWDEAPLAERLVKLCLIEEELAREPIELSSDELQAAVDAYRRGRRLYTAEQTREWMALRGLTHEQLERLVSDEATIAKLRERVAAGRVEPHFADHRAEFDTARIARIAFADEASARAARAEIEAGAIGFAELAERRFLDDPAESAVLHATIRRGEAPPELATAVFSVRSGTLVGPIPVTGEYLLARVLDFKEATLDGATRREIQRRLFEAWLEERRREATIEWFWGPISAGERWA
jgi:putative peptide maturation system protein